MSARAASRPARSRSTSDAAARAARHPATWIAVGAVVAVALRVPWFDAAFGRDEGGVAYIARAWHTGGPFTYGDYFLDRPPLLLALYRLAGDSIAGVRTLGALAAAATGVLAGVLAQRIAGLRAAA